MTGEAHDAYVDADAAAANLPDKIKAAAADTAPVTEDDYDPELPGRKEPPTLEAMALDRFRAAAKRLKATELEFRAAQQAYAEAVKDLSDEAVK